MRTAVLAPAAAYAVGTVRNLVHRDVHRACILADPAFCASAAVKFVAVEGNRVEEAVNCTQRTEIAAEGPVGNHGQDNQKNKQQAFPCKQPSDHRADIFIQYCQRPSSHQGA